MLIRFAITLMFALSTVVSYPRIVSAQSDATGVGRLTIDDAIARVDQIFDALKELQQTIDVSTYDLDVVTRDMQLVDDPSEILDWVQSNVSYEAYTGLLRGARGTVLSRAGNALDQAVLLAGLIKDAGFEARIVRGTLSDEQAQKLLERMVVRLAEWPETSLVDYKAILRDTARDHVESPEVLAQVLGAIDAIPDSLSNSDIVVPAAVGELSDVLLAQVSGHTRFDSDLALTALRNEARDYFWVQYRDSAAGPWEAAHPAFGPGGMDAEGVEVVETYIDTIPEDLQHRVRFEVFIEQRLGGETEQAPLMPAWERPAANLVGVPITYFNHPDGATLANMQEFGSARAALDQTEFFIPVFNGQLPADSRFFGLDGFTAPADVAGTPYAAFFKTVGGALFDAATAISNLGGSGEAGPAAELVSQTMRVTLIAPGGVERPIERTIWRRQADAEADDSAIRQALATRLTTMIALGRYPTPVVLSELLGWVESHRGRAVMAVRSAWATDSAEFADALRNFKDADDSIIHLLAFTFFDGGADKIAEMAYRPSPTVGMLRTPLFPDETSSLTFDILANDRIAIKRSEAGEPTVSPENGVRIGVWESLAERVAAPGGMTSVDVFEAAAAEGIPLRVLSSVDSPDLLSVELSSEMLGHVQQDISDGYLVVLPERIPRATGVSGWWRVDPVNGNTIGYLETGIGGNAVLYIVLVSAISGAVGLACYVEAVAPDVDAGVPVDASDKEFANCAIGVGGIVFMGAGGEFVFLAGAPIYAVGLGLVIAFSGAMLLLTTTMNALFKYE